MNILRSLFFLSLLCIAACQGPGEVDPDSWVSLFNGKDLTGWVRADGSPAAAPGQTQCWTVKDGALHIPEKSGAGSIYSAKEYGDFELDFEWKIDLGGNSGVKYRVARYNGNLLGPEYQILDDEYHNNGSNPLTCAASLYALCEPKDNKRLEPVGRYNRGRIVAKGSIFQHWLNGEKVLEIDISSDDYKGRVSRSKFKPYEDYGSRPGRIMLQDHSNAVWFRAIRIREL